MFFNGIADPAVRVLQLFKNHSMMPKAIMVEVIPAQ